MNINNAFGLMAALEVAREGQIKNGKRSPQNMWITEARVFYQDWVAKVSREGECTLDEAEADLKYGLRQIEHYNVLPGL